MRKSKTGNKNSVDFPDLRIESQNSYELEDL